MGIGIGNIEGFSNYRVTLCGKVVSLKNSHRQYRIKYLKPNLHSGYKKVILQQDGFIKDLFIHRLIALSFIKNPNNYPHINHKDGNKQNNFIGNLEWCTRSQNVRHALDNNLLIPKSKGEHYRAKIVLDLETGIYYDSQKDFAIAKNLRYSVVKNHFQKKKKKSKYKFIQI